MTSLPRNQQWRNVALYSCINCLTYLAAPVAYVGITQASLCASLGASDTVANLPTSAFFWAAIFLVVIAARFHKVSATRYVLAGAYALLASASMVVVFALWWPLPAFVRLAAVVVYGGLAGAAIGVRNVYLWEVVNRGIAAELRGWAYSLSFGVGPLFAVAGSLLAQLLLTGQVELPLPSLTEGFALTRLEMPPLAFPLNFLTVFGATVPVLGIAAILSSRFQLPPSDDEERPLRLTASIAQSVGEMSRDRILLIAIVAYVLVDAGGTITNNMALYNAEILHKSAEQFAGYQNALRFGCKMTVGLVLGWLLVRTHAKMGMVVTALFCISGIIGALTLSDSTFLLCFGLMGAGELYGIYYLNYIMARSHPGRLRQNMAMLQLLSLATSIAPAAFGALADNYGLPTSFIAAACVVACSLTLIVFGLPARPRPPLEVSPSLV
jgi:MFS family permease